MVVGLFVLYIVQTSLPEFRDSYPAVAALHPVLALGIFVLSIQIARMATAARSEPSPRPPDGHCRPARVRPDGTGSAPHREGADRIELRGTGHRWPVCVRRRCAARGNAAARAIDLGCGAGRSRSSSPSRVRGYRRGLLAARPAEGIGPRRIRNGFGPERLALLPGDLTAGHVDGVDGPFDLLVDYADAATISLPPGEEALAGYVTRLARPGSRFFLFRSGCVNLHDPAAADRPSLGPPGSPRVWVDGPQARLRRPDPGSRSGTDERVHRAGPHETLELVLAAIGDNRSLATGQGDRAWCPKPALRRGRRETSRVRPRARRRRAPSPR